jgi:hypothetical protein
METVFVLITERAVFVTHVRLAQAHLTTASFVLIVSVNLVATTRPVIPVTLQELKTMLTTISVNASLDLSGLKTILMLFVRLVMEIALNVGIQ